MSKKILILAANPKNSFTLEIPREIREILEGLKRSRYREQFEVEERLAVRPQDLRRAILEVQPHIVHFCGHGTGNQGLILENDTGKEHLVSTQALSNLFKLFAEQVECVVLNACYSEIQGEAIKKHINYVIGMRQEIIDQAAIAFSVARVRVQKQRNTLAIRRGILLSLLAIISFGLAIFKHKQPVKTVNFLDQETIVSGSDDKKIRIWSLIPISTKNHSDKKILIKSCIWLNKYLEKKSGLVSKRI